MTPSIGQGLFRSRRVTPPVFRVIAGESFVLVRHHLAGALHRLVHRLPTRVGLVIAFFISTAATPSHVGAAPSVATVRSTPNEVSSGAATKLGAYDPNATLKLVIGLRAPHPAAEEQFLQALQDKNSPLFHQYLTPQQWDAQFGPSIQSEQAVVDWATASGLTVTKRYSHRLIVDVAGSTSVVSRVFGVAINQYRLGSRTFYSNDRDPAIPASLAGVVLSVVGLNNLLLAHSSAKILPAASPPPAPRPDPVVQSADSWSQADGDPSQLPPADGGARGQAMAGGSFTAGFIDPRGLWSSQAYDFTALYRQGHCCNPFHVSGGSPINTSIVIFTGCLFNVSDLKAFAKQYGLAWNVNWVEVDGPTDCGDPKLGTTPNLETTLDTEYSVAMSNSFGSSNDTAHVWLYYGQSTDKSGNPNPAGLNMALTTMTDGYAAVLDANGGNGNGRNFSTSWGAPEATWGSGELSTDLIFASMQGLGWTLTAAAGDNGAYDNGNTNPPMTDYPASSTYITAAGGTQLALASNGTYASEITWDDAKGSGGGGCSELPAASYQNGLSSPCGAQRAVPDLSLNASCTTGQAIFINGSWSGACGTSEVAPELAGFFAQENAYLLTEGNICGPGVGTQPCSPFGSFNAPLYNAFLANEPGVTRKPPHNPFYDITLGDNDNGTGTGIYPAGKGYDLATGLGSANMLQMAWAVNWTVFADGTPPSVNENGLTEPKVGVWYNTNQTVSFKLVDNGGPFPAAGIAGWASNWESDPGDPGNPGHPGGGTTFYGVYHNDETSGTATFAQAGQGCHELFVRTWDNQGLVSPMFADGVYCYDTVPPVTTLNYAGDLQTGCNGDYFAPVKITLAATDKSSGVASTTYSLDLGPLTTYSKPFTVSATGPHGLIYSSVDVAGNQEKGKVANFTSVTPAISLVPISGLPGTSINVAGSNFLNGETVNIYWDTVITGTQLGSAPTTNCAFSATILTPSSLAGTHPIIAVGQTSGQKATATFTVP